jgi:plasmid stabilization system protein ParE
MKLHLRRADEFTADFEGRIRWFRDQGGADIAIRFLYAVDTTLDSLAQQPGIGRKRRFIHPKLQGLRSFLITRPFNKYLVFYRFDSTYLYAFRLMHGARDLPRRLLQEPSDE